VRLSTRSSPATSSADPRPPRNLPHTGGAGRSSLSALWAARRFRRLLATRLTSQCSDGIFQASLAGAILFNPEHHTGPTQVAVGFVVLLLPYSLIGPFAGVFLDRWRRQRILGYGAAVRAALVVVAAVELARHGPNGVWFVLAALAALAVNRFYLAALSAALPSVVAEERLLLANAISPTAGTVATIIGAGIGLALRAAGGGADIGDAVAALVAAGGYLAAAALAATLPRDSLGPHPFSPAPLRKELAGVGRGLVDGLRHLAHRPHAARALGVVVGQRFLFGVWSIMALLLYRNSFHNDGFLRAGIVGAGQAVTAAGIGLVIGAVVTPSVTARIGRRHWIVTVTAGVAVTSLVLGAPFRIAPLLLSAVALGFTSQSTKVCVDTLVQTNIDDVYRGRVFAVYDTVYNLSFVAAALVAALVLPNDGRSIGALIAMSVGYLLIAVVYARSERHEPAGSIPRAAAHS
jgi:MFS family permease